eukprot:scaffold1958_cov91-Skeletonema_dohrnii-CCMP3373.AAC.1
MEAPPVPRTPLCCILPGPRGPITDTLIGAEVLLDQGEAESLAKVVRRSVDEKGNLIGTYSENPLVSTQVYDLEMPDGTIREYGANVIAENMLRKSSPEELEVQELDAIVDHRRDGDALRRADMYIKPKGRKRRLRQSTRGWRLLVKWKNGTTQWLPLKELKESSPIEVAEYATAKGIVNEPAFLWWCPYVLRKRDVIISAVKARYFKVTHKYGHELPRSMADVARIDKENGNTLWQDSVKKEMTNIGIAFDILEHGEEPPRGYTKSSGHLIWDLKMDGTRMSRWVKDGHKTPDILTSSYAGVVSKESIRIALTYAAQHNIPVVAADVRNAYLQAPTSERHYVVCGPEFGLENVGKKAIINWSVPAVLCVL